MKTVIAEKPSVAREIARVVKATRREAGYLTGNGYNVTWAFGHLVQPALPDGYGIKGFHPVSYTHLRAHHPSGVQTDPPSGQK